MNLAAEIKIGSKTYLIERLPAFDQMHLIADAQPILAGLAIAKQDRPKEMSDEDFLKGVQMITVAAGGLAPERRERIWNTCLKMVRRKETGALQPVLSAPSEMQFADLDPPTIAKLMYTVFEHNKLLDFFSDSLSGSEEQTKTEGSGQASRTAKTG